MAPKNKIIDPNLLISFDPDDHKTLEKVAKLYYGENLTPDELDEKIEEMITIITIFDQLGLSFDVEKIEKIIKNMRKQRENTGRIIQKYSMGQLSFLVPPNITQLEYLAHILNNVTKKSFSEIEKSIGKRNYKKLFCGHLPHYIADDQGLKIINTISGS